ncbi:TPA: hypothetical protein I7171_21115 [Vibrio vulnificus]|nr:hypothetical protein [Vibrio vulnificus]
MDNYEKALQVINENKKLLQAKLNEEFKTEYATYSVSKYSGMTVNEIIESMQQDLEFTFRRETEDILEANGIEIEFELEDLEDVRELRFELILDLSFQLESIINQNVNEIFNKAVKAGLVRESLKEQFNDLVEHLGTEGSFDLDTCSVNHENGCSGELEELSFHSAEELAKYHILMAGDLFFNDRPSKKVELMLELTSIHTPEIIKGVKLYVSSALTISEAARVAGINHPSTLSNALKTIKNITPIVDKLSYFKDTKVFV